MITIEECEARIWNDPKLMAEALNDGDLAGFLTCSFSPRNNDACEFGERVRDFINACVQGRADWMVKEMQESASEDGAEHESRCMDRAEAKAINAGRF